MRIFKRLRERNPKLLFLLENVEVGKEWEAVISNTLGLKGVHINAALVSAQNRKRIYWSNIRVREEGMFGWRYTDIPQPEDRHIFLKDILESEVDEKYYLSDEVVANMMQYTLRNKEKGNGFGAVFHDGEGKMSTLTVGGRGKDDLVKVKKSDTPFEPHPNKHLKKNLTDVDGKAQTFLATSGKGAWANGMTLISEPVCISSLQAHATVSVGKSYPMVAAMGMGGGHVPMIARKTIQLNGSKESNGVQPYQQNRVYDANGIAPACMANLSCGSYAVLNEGRIRRITPTEAARLQTIPECYHWTCSETQQYRLLGNGWCVEVIKHILSFMNIE